MINASYFDALFVVFKVKKKTTFSELALKAQSQSTHVVQYLDGFLLAGS